MDLIVWPDPADRQAHRGVARFGERRYPCALGRSGVRAEKREGDGATPAGCWRIRRILYRADRQTPPSTGLPVGMIGRDDGWCDAPADPRYNQAVRLPHAASAERLWRDDGLYDVIAVLDYNLEPVTPGKGSAIFLHVARPDYGPTAGCVALALAHLLEVLAECAPDSRVCARSGRPG